MADLNKSDWHANRAEGVFNFDNDVEPFNEKLRSFHAALATAIKEITWNHK
jgi:hypothetical protein